jgi:SM-20-related protein
MADSIPESIASIVAALMRGETPRLSARDLRLLSRVAAGSREATFVLGGITAVLAANDVIKRVPGTDVGPVFPLFDDDGPVPITPGPYPPDFPQPVTPGPYPPDFPQPVSPPPGPQPIEGPITRPWFEQMVRYVVLEEFLVPAELESLTRFALENEDRFEISQVVTPGKTSGSVDFQSRRSKVLTDIGSLGDMFRERVRSVLPLVGQRLGADTRHSLAIDVQMTASNDQEFFVAHVDNGPAFPTRAISYVYFFNKEPAAFSGGELTLFHSDAAAADGSPARFTTIVPTQNQIVLFPSSLLHEVKPLSVPSQAFSDSRFTVNGWIHL